tara:strand:+ start:1442 stop:1780 length:339 start_codon:yes stop_codon:yes gene_type:complete
MDPWFTQRLIQEKKYKMERLGKFAEIEKEHIHGLRREHDAEAVQWKFPNGYGASIASNQITHYTPELAVLKFDEMGESSLVYDTPITSDVIPRVNVGDAKVLLGRIKSLPVQ